MPRIRAYLRTGLQDSFLIVIVCASPTALNATTTPDNLPEASSGESNLGCRYVAFAPQVGSQGFDEISGFFQAAVRVDEIQAANHAHIITETGGVCPTDISLPAVETASNNPEAAIRGQFYRLDMRYFGLLKEARSVRDTRAMWILYLTRRHLPVTLPCGKR